MVCHFVIQLISKSVLC